MLPNGQPMFGDYIAFWCAGDMANHGEALVVHSDPETRACQNRVNPEIRRFAPYNSPPTFLLFDLAAGARAVRAVGDAVAGDHRRDLSASRRGSCCRTSAR